MKDGKACGDNRELLKVSKRNRAREREREEEGSREKVVRYRRVYRKRLNRGRIGDLEGFVGREGEKVKTAINLQTKSQFSKLTADKVRQDKLG